MGFWPVNWKSPSGYTPASEARMCDRLHVSGTGKIIGRGRLLGQRPSNEDHPGLDGIRENYIVRSIVAEGLIERRKNLQSPKMFGNVSRSEASDAIDRQKN